MRPAIISACSAAGLALGGWAMPIVFPKVEPAIAEYMLWVAGALLMFAFVLWLWGLRGPDAQAATQTTAGGSSPNFGTVTGPVTLNYAPPSPPMTQERKDPYGPRSPQAGWTEDGLSGLQRAIAGYQPKPDFPLAGVLVLVYKALGGIPSERHLRDEFFRQVDLTIADAIVENNLSVWGRVLDRPRQRISMASLRAGRLLHVWKYLEVPTDAVRPTRYTDLMFNKAEVLDVWSGE
jgi:hypothetical protein